VDFGLEWWIRLSEIDLLAKAQLGLVVRQLELALGHDRWRGDGRVGGR